MEINIYDRRLNKIYKSGEDIFDLDDSGNVKSWGFFAYANQSLIKLKSFSGINPLPAFYLETFFLARKDPLEEYQSGDIPIFDGNHIVFN